VNFPPSNVSANNPDNSINWAQFTPISSSPGFWYKNRVPYAEHYSLSIQRQLGSDSLLSLAYVGTQGHAQLVDLESNVGNPALCLSVSQTSQVTPTSGTCGPFGWARHSSLQSIACALLFTCPSPLFDRTGLNRYGIYTENRDMATFFVWLFRSLRLVMSGHPAIAIENAALRIQLAAFRRKRRRPVCSLCPQ